ncbi:MAG: hypothetical protein ABW321_20780 [Polyangiales bacterium]
MTNEEAQRVLFLHWPGFMPQARTEEGQYVVRLVTWPPSAAPKSAAKRGELEAYSREDFAAALRDLASFTPPLIKCREPGCVLCD